MDLFVWPRYVKDLERPSMCALKERERGREYVEKCEFKRKRMRRCRLERERESLKVRETSRKRERERV